ncbi:MAG: hypothetical protein WCG29_13005, partial [Desulfomonile sp.]
GGLMDTRIMGNICYSGLMKPACGEDFLRRIHNQSSFLGSKRASLSGNGYSAFWFNNVAIRHCGVQDTRE